MKTIKYIISTAILLLSLATFAQGPGGSSFTFSTVKDFDYDPSELMGPWVARNGVMTYELSFIIDTVSKENFMLVVDTPSSLKSTKYRRLVGTMVYKRRGVVVRTISPQSHPKYMSIIGAVGGSDPSYRSYMVIYFDDLERDVSGKATFKLVEGNHDKATWDLLKTWGDGTFDIPRKMTFSRARPSKPLTGVTIGTDGGLQP